MPGTTFTTLTAEEVPQIAGLLAELATHHNEVALVFAGRYPIYSLETQVEEAQKMVAEGEARVDVVRKNGELAGFGMASISGRNGEIDFLYVSPRLRSRGLGKKLMDRLMAFLRDKNAAFVDLRVVRGNPAKRFYKKYGFQTRSEILSMEMPPPPASLEPGASRIPPDL